MNNPALKKLAVLVLVIAGPIFAICLLITIFSFAQSGSSGPKGQEIVHGELHVSAPAKDTLTGKESLLIVRKTEMYQYYPYELTDDDNVETHYSMGWRETYVEPFTDNLSEERKNPPFPDRLRSEELIGRAEIGEGGVSMSKDLIRLFDQGTEEEMSPNMVGIELPADILERYQLVQVRPGYYISRDKKEEQIGCIRVSFRMLDPALAGAPVTAAANFTDAGELGDPRSQMLLYPREVSNEEIIEDYQASKKGTGLLSGILTYGLGLLDIGAVIVLVLGKKKEL